MSERYEARRLPARYPGERIEWWGVWDSQTRRLVEMELYNTPRDAETAARRHNAAYERAQS